MSRDVIPTQFVHFLNWLYTIKLCLSQLVTSQVSCYQHPAVQLQFFETVIRYDKFFSTEPQHVQELLVCVYLITTHSFSSTIEIHSSFLGFCEFMIIIPRVQFVCQKYLSSTRTVNCGVDIWKPSTLPQCGNEDWVLSSISRRWLDRVLFPIVDFETMGSPASNALTSQPYSRP